MTYSGSLLFWLPYAICFSHAEFIELGQIENDDAANRPARRGFTSVSQSVMTHKAWLWSAVVSRSDGTVQPITRHTE